MKILHSFFAFLGVKVDDHMFANCGLLICRHRKGDTLTYICTSDILKYNVLQNIHVNLKLLYNMHTTLGKHLHMHEFMHNYVFILRMEEGRVHQGLLQSVDEQVAQDHE